LNGIIDNKKNLKKKKKCNKLNVKDMQKNIKLLNKEQTILIRIALK
jgi:hypothetical protein